MSNVELVLFPLLIVTFLHLKILFRFSTTPSSIVLLKVFSICSFSWPVSSDLLSFPFLGKVSAFTNWILLKNTFIQVHYAFMTMTFTRFLYKSGTDFLEMNYFACLWIKGLNSKQYLRYLIWRYTKCMCAFSNVKYRAHENYTRSTRKLRLSQIVEKAHSLHKDSKLTFF